jgi:hypothetical protein
MNNRQASLAGQSRTSFLGIPQGDAFGTQVVVNEAGNSRAKSFFLIRSDPDQVPVHHSDEVRFATEGIETRGD